MARAAGTALRTLSTLIRLIQFLTALAILGIFSYFLAVLSRHNLDIPTRTKAVEGVAGAAALYALIGFLLTCCLGGFTFFAFLAIVLDILFIGAFIAVAILTRGSITTCDPLGSQDSMGPVTQAPEGSGPDIGEACRLEKAAFIMAIILIGLFLISAILQLFLGRHHQREKREPNYSRKTSSMAPIWSRNKRNRDALPNTPVVATEKKPPFWKRNKKAPRDAEYAAAGAGVGATAAHHHHEKTHQHQNDVRPSHDSRLTDNTAVSPGHTHSSEYKTYKPDRHSGYREAAVNETTTANNTTYNTGNNTAYAQPTYGNTHAPHTPTGTNYTTGPTTTTTTTSYRNSGNNPVTNTGVTGEGGYPYNTVEAANAAYEGRNVGGYGRNNY